MQPDRSYRRRPARGAKPNPVAVVIFALVLVALVVTAVISLLRKPPIVPQGQENVPASHAIVTPSQAGPGPVPGSTPGGNRR